MSILGDFVTHSLQNTIDPWTCDQSDEETWPDHDKDRNNLEDTLKELPMTFPTFDNEDDWDNEDKGDNGENDDNDTESTPWS